MRQDTYKNTPFGDSSLDIEKRIDWLLDELTVDEKCTLLSSSSNDIERLGINAMGVGGEAAHGVEARNDQNGIGEPDISTSFPEPIGMSSSWDTELIRKAGEVTGKEARVIYHRHPRGGLSRWAPTIDMERDPRWGRNEEGYGEDPVLTGAMASAYIQGMQGNHPRYLRIAATLKHFYANNVEFGRGWKNSSVDPRNKYEYYLEPFRRAIVHGGAEGVMTAYNRINGTQGLFNDDVQKILKDQYGLGHAVSDGAAMGLVVSLSHDNGLDAETIARSLKAGVDQMSDRPDQVCAAAREAYELGLISEEDIDKALRNMFRLKLRLGIYDKENANPYDLVTEDDLCSEENSEICRKLTEKSIVLLKNENILPLKSRENNSNYVLIGPVANEWYQDWYGGRPHHKSTLHDSLNMECYDAKNHVYLLSGDKYLATDKTGHVILSSEPEEFIMDEWGENAYTFRSAASGKYMSTQIVEDGEKSGEVYTDSDEIFGWFALQVFHMEKLSSGKVILQSRFADPLYADENGLVYSSQNNKNDSPLQVEIKIIEDGITEAVNKAKKADTVIMALGHNPMVNAKEETDRESIDFIPYQQKLFDAVYEVNPNIVVVLISDYPFAINEINDKAKAIIWSATGSQDMGEGIAAAIWGKFSPAGRLAQTWYKHDSDLPDIDDYDIINHPRTYRYFDREVLYPFGYGMTYTKFEYSDFDVKVIDNSRLDISLTVTNSGETMSDEVVQIYAVSPAARAKKPLRQLIGFTRVEDIEPHESVEVTFDISVDELRYYDVTREELIVEKGIYKIFAGANCEDEAVSAEISVDGLMPGTRSMSSKIKADHYDIQSGAQIVEGKFGYKALMSISTGAYEWDSDMPHEFSAEYNDCVFEEGHNILRIHAYIPENSEIKILIDDRKISCITTNTQAYEVRPVVFRDSLARAVSDFNNLKKSWPVIWADVRIPLTDIEYNRPCKMTIVCKGKVKYDWFETIKPEEW